MNQPDNEKCILGQTKTHGYSPMYQKKFAYGSKGFPWTADFSRKNINYKKGICPNAENLNKEKLILLELCVHEYSEKEVDLVIKCFEKVWSNLKYLKK